LLGIVTAVRGSGGKMVIQTKPAVLDRIYSDPRVRIDPPLDGKSQLAGTSA